MRGAPWGGALARVVEFVVARLVKKKILRAFGPQKKYDICRCCAVGDKPVTVAIYNNPPTTGRICAYLYEA